MRAAIACTLMGLAACGSRGDDERPRQHARFASLGFDMPADWQHKDDTKADGVQRTTWAPNAKDNDRKETLTIVRSERIPAIAKASAATLEHMLAAAQRALPEVRASQITSSTTPTGQAWARIEVDFVPPGQRVSYHRVHVILVDHGALVNVLYTAREPDADLDVLTTVLASIRHEEA